MGTFRLESLGDVPSPPLVVSVGEFLLVLSSASSGFFGFLGAPNALNHALKFGVAEGLSVLAAAFVTFSGDSITFPDRVRASSAFTALISS